MYSQHFVRIFLLLFSTLFLLRSNVWRMSFSLYVLFYVHGWMGLLFFQILSPLFSFVSSLCSTLFPFCLPHFLYPGFPMFIGLWLYH